jgi:cytochrome P450 family 49 subfamily A
MKHVTTALQKLDKEESGELSVLQRVLRLENDTKTASNLALDMFLVGIDTVSNTLHSRCAIALNLK